MILFFWPLYFLIVWQFRFFWQLKSNFVFFSYSDFFFEYFRAVKKTKFDLRGQNNSKKIRNYEKKINKIYFNIINIDLLG